MKFLNVIFFTLFSTVLFSQSSENIQNRILSNSQVNDFLRETVHLRTLNGIYQTDCDTAKCSYKNNFFEILGNTLKKNFPSLIIRDKNKIAMDIYSPEEKNHLLFGGDEFDQKKNSELKETVEEFFDKQFFSYVFCMQKFNPVYDFESKSFSFKVFENINNERDEYLKSDAIEIPVPEDKAEKLKKNIQHNAIVCKFKLDIQTKTEVYGVGLIYQIIETDCGIWDFSDEKFYFKAEEKPTK